MAHPFVCPWQAGGVLTLSARAHFQNPERILSPYIKKGMTVLDVGCGMGYLSIPMARMVGGSGKVVAADLQPEMLDGLVKNARSAGAEQIIEPHLCEKHAMNLTDYSGKIDFATLFMVLHEVPDRERMVREVTAALAPGGLLLFAEPIVHVGRASFEKSLRIMLGAGLEVAGTPRVAICRAVVLRKV